MTSPQAGAIRDALRLALMGAMKQRDKAAVATYRAAIAAIDNAEAVPVGDGDRAGAIEASRFGPGAAEVARRELSEAEVARIVRAEISEAQTAADLTEARDPEGAALLRAGAALLDDLLAADSTDED